MTSLLHISDTHFGTEVPQALAALLRLAQKHSPDVLVLSGDITQRARTAQFEAARRFIHSLQVRQVLVLAGNHDIPLFDLRQRLWAPYAGFRRTFGEALEPSIDLPALRIAGVHTARAWRHVVGHVSAAQAQRSAAWLAAAPRPALRIAVTHHPLAVPDAEDAAQRVRGAAGALRLWSAARVHLVLGGHIHRPYFLPVDSVLPDGPHRLWVVQAGTAVSHRVRPPYPHSVNLLRQITAARWELSRWNLEPRAADFSLSQTLLIDTGAGAA
jgi:3',5'-cyclic AMP phosphodiesterase CpdA